MNKFQKSLDRIKKNVPLHEDSWTDEDKEHIITIMQALEKQALEEEPPEFNVIDIDETDELFRVAKGIIKEDCTISCVNEEAFYKIIEFFQKQTPRKPELATISSFGTKLWICPACECDDVETNNNFCHDCGQALDWSDTE